MATTGIVTGCQFNQLEYFHVVDNTTPDVMHDLLEGACPYILRLVLGALMKGSNQYFNLDLLNKRIQAFNYGYIDASNRPPNLSKNSFSSSESSLRMSASEMWCLILNIPLVIGDKVPELDPHWELLLSLLEIMSYVFAPAITVGATYYSQHVIADHLELFRQLFLEETLKPKQHYLLHYPRCITRVAPLVRLWCMRFEAKHNFLNG